MVAKNKRKRCKSCKRSRVKKSRNKNKYKKRRTRKRKTLSNKKGGNKINPVNVGALKNKLKSYNIDLSKWSGEFKNKTVQQLFKEIKNGDSIIKEENNTLFRLVNVANAVILSNDGLYKLREKEHLDENMNVVKVRGNEVLSEKMDTNEDVTNAIIRGVKEELGDKYSNNVEFLTESKTNVKKVEKSSYSYPGLKSIYYFHEKIIKIPLLTLDFPPPSEFLTKETTNDGVFKRYIVWDWVSN